MLVEPLAGMKPTVLCLLVAATLVAGARTAGAQAPGQTPWLAPAAPAPVYESITTTERYGYQIALADGAAIAAGLATENGGAMIGLYLAGGPIIHFSHGQVGRGFLSLGLRVGLPYLGAIVGAAVGESNCQGVDDEWFCGVGELLLGGALGAVAASVIDWTVLAKKTTTMERESLFQVGSVRANPNLGVTRGGVSLGLSGSF